MPQAITVTDAQGRWAVYVPLRVVGRSWCRKRLVDSAAAAYPQIAAARGGYRRRQSWANSRPFDLPAALNED